MIDKSHGELGENCRESLSALYVFLDGEMTPDRASEVKRHVEACQPCLEAFDFEAELRRAVRSACGSHGSAPQELRVRIAQVLGITVQSGD